MRAYVMTPIVLYSSPAGLLSDKFCIGKIREERIAQECRTRRTLLAVESLFTVCWRNAFRRKSIASLDKFIHACINSFLTYARVYKNYPLQVYRVFLRFSLKRLILFYYPDSWRPSHRYYRHVRKPVPPDASIVRALPGQVLLKRAAFLRVASSAPEIDPPQPEKHRLLQESV